MKALFNALLLMAAMLTINTANAQRNPYTFMNDYMKLDGLGGTTDYNGQYHSLVVLTNFTGETFETRITIPEYNVDTTVTVEPYAYQQMFDLGVNVIPEIYEDIKPLHIFAAVHQPDYNFVLKDEMFLDNRPNTGKGKGKKK